MSVIKQMWDLVEKKIAEHVPNPFWKLYLLAFGIENKTELAILFYGKAPTDERLIRFFETVDYAWPTLLYFLFLLALVLLAPTIKNGFAWMKDNFTAKTQSKLNGITRLSFERSQILLLRADLMEKDIKKEREINNELKVQANELASRLLIQDTNFRNHNEKHHCEVMLCFFSLTKELELPDAVIRYFKAVTIFKNLTEEHRRFFCHDKDEKQAFTSECYMQGLLIWIKLSQHFSRPDIAYFYAITLSKFYPELPNHYKHNFHVSVDRLKRAKFFDKKNSHHKLFLDSYDKLIERFH